MRNKIIEMTNQVTKLMGNEIEEVDFKSNKYRDSAVVHIVGAVELTDLPPELTTLKIIRTLAVRDCENLKRLPENIGDMVSLEIITIGRCPSLKVIPRSIGRLSKLRKIYIYDTGIVGLPDTIGGLKNLEELIIRQCKNFEYLPDSICDIGEQSSFLERNITIEDTILNRIPMKIAKIKRISNLNLRDNKIDKLPYQIFMGETTLRRINLTNNVGMIANLVGTIKISEVKEKMVEEEWKNGQKIELGDEDAMAELVAMIEEVQKDSEME